MNPFETPMSVEVVPATSAVEAVQRAEVDVQIATAHRFPRRLPNVKQEMMGYATLDQETAESCFYSLPRGNKTIQGPSVRLAEIAASCYGNMRVGSRVISVEAQGETPHVIVQSVCHDLERNIAVTMEKRRRITSKKNRDGSRRPVDEDDINLATNACAAIAFRDAVFKVVPLALVKPVLEAAKRTAIGDQKTLADRRARCVDTFGKMGVAKERVFAVVEKSSIEEIGLPELETLMGLYSAIKDGAIDIDTAFPAVTAPSNPLEGRKPKAKPSTSFTLPHEPATQGVNQGTGDPTPAPAPAETAPAETATPPDASTQSGQTEKQGGAQTGGEEMPPTVRLDMMIVTILGRNPEGQADDVIEFINTKFPTKAVGGLAEVTNDLAEKVLACGEKQIETWVKQNIAFRAKRKNTQPGVK